MVDNILSNVYYDTSHPAAFRGENSLVRAVRNRVNEKDVKKWLQTQDTFTLHRPVRRKYPMLHYTVNNIDDLWETDLVDMQSVKTYNSGISFLLICIDVLSKYVWVYPLKNKTNVSIVNAFESLFKKTERRPLTIQSDAGKEFIGKIVQDYFKKNDINFRLTRNPDVKAAVVERFNRTLKSKMFRYFTYANTRKYVDVLQNFVDSYNRTIHSSIKMRPIDVTLENAHKAYENLRKKYKSILRKSKYKVNQLIRISRKRGVFEKAYYAGWTEEIFRITKILKHRTPSVYEIKDLNDEPIDGFFYEEELNPVIKNNDEEYIVERILRTSGQGRNKKYLIKWKGYNDSFNSWIPASDLRKL